MDSEPDIRDDAAYTDQLDQNEVLLAGIGLANTVSLRVLAFHQALERPEKDRNGVIFFWNALHHKYQREQNPAAKEA